MYLKNIIQFLVFFVVVFFVGCSNNGICLSNQQAVQISFFSGSNGVESDTTITGLSVYGLGKDSILYDSVSIQHFFLPLNLNTERTDWVIEEVKAVGNDIYSQHDTITFVYNKELNYVSGNCGLTYTLYLDTVMCTTFIIDSVKVSYPIIKYEENLENVKIYIRP